MARKTTLTFALMDPPFESARSTTALRLIDAALRRGHTSRLRIRGGGALAFARSSHPMRCTDGSSRRGPSSAARWSPRLWPPRKRRTRLEWVNCGLCVVTVR